MMRIIGIRGVLKEDSPKEDNKYIVLVNGEKKLCEYREFEYRVQSDYPEQNVVELINKLIYSFKDNDLERILFVDYGLVKEEIEEDDKDTNKDE